MSKFIDPSNSRVLTPIKTNNFTNREWELVKKYTPCIKFDNKEPFKPVRVGVSIYYDRHLPPSVHGLYTGLDDSGHFKVDFEERCLKHQFNYKVLKLIAFFKTIFLNIAYQRPFALRYLYINRFQEVLMTIFDGYNKQHRAKRVIEYAVYYDSDIGHIYELEHVWVYLGMKDEIIGIKATKHGLILTQYANKESIKYLKGHKNHPLLYASPGKHAYYTHPRLMKEIILANECIERTAKGVMKDIQFFTEKDWKQIFKTYPKNGLIESEFKKRFAFLPSFKFDNFLIPDESLLVPWDELREEIPNRIANFIKNLF